MSNDVVLGDASSVFNSESGDCAKQTNGRRLEITITGGLTSLNTGGTPVSQRSRPDGLTSPMRMVLLVVFLFVIHAGALVSQAKPTLQDVFKSTNENVDSTVDLSKALPYFLAGTAIIILAVLYNNRRQNVVRPRKLKHVGKLQRELCKAISLRSSELKQLKTLAEEQDLQFPLTLLLCPSTLGKALHTQNPKVDRAILKQIVQRMRESLSGPGRGK
jgi:hypothetical protein